MEIVISKSFNLFYYSVLRKCMICFMLTLTVRYFKKSAVIKLKDEFETIVGAMISYNSNGSTLYWILFRLPWSTERRNQLRQIHKDIWIRCLYSNITYSFVFHILRWDWLFRIFWSLKMSEKYYTQTCLRKVPRSTEKIWGASRLCAHDCV